MPFDRRPLVGALVIGAFITICLGWLLAGAGAPMPFWGYPFVFAIFAVWLYAVGRLLTGCGKKSGRVRSFDISSEIQ
jgi:hypothetical protein